MKTISQNPDRYSKQGANWVISASPDILPIYLPVGVSLSNLKPLIKANGIVIKVGEDYLCSTNTLNEIKVSNNPHYDIVENGEVIVKDKRVVIGKTIKIIELNLTDLTEIIASRDTLNRNAGVIDVIYGPETESIDGVPKGIIDQINYTLDQSSDRPMDSYSIFDFYGMVDYMNNPNAAHYKITPLLVQTQQADTVFDPTKLREYLIEVSDKLKLLERDFNFIQDIFYESKLPNSPTTFTETQQAMPDVETNNNHTVRRYSRSQVAFEDNSLNQTKNELQDAITEVKEEMKQEVENQAPKPTIEKWRLRRKRDGDKNGMGIYPTVNFKNFNLAKNKKADKRAGIIREGETFTGYKFKTFDNGFSVWAIQSTPDAAPTGYAYQGRGDDVDKA
jgi:hypothetical protein